MKLNSNRIVPRRSGSFLGPPQAESFTLIELLVVIGIIAVLMAAVVPAVTSLKSSGDVAAAAYTIKGTLERARNYAMANNTYTWVGFFEEDAESVGVAGSGRVIMSAVASIDGTNIYASGSGVIDRTKLTPIGKLVKVDNLHLPLFAIGSGTGDTFDTRPSLQSDPIGGYNYSRFGELNAPPPNTAPYSTPYRFQYPTGNPAAAVQYTFQKLLQFNPFGEARVNGNSYKIRKVVEIGLVATHGSLVPTPMTGAGTSTAIYKGNVVALQLSGLGGDIKLYQR